VNTAVLGLLVAEATDSPVWVLAGATIALAVVTAVLAIAAIRALKQLGFAIEELDEVKRDRHVQAFSDLGRRWDSPTMEESLKKEADYTQAQLADLVVRAAQPLTNNRLKDWHRRRARKELVVLLRVPNYFEDLALITKAGGLDIKLVAADFKGLAQDEWVYWEAAILRLRDTDPWSFTQFERLVREMELLPDE
jgi:hypothetical protein